MIIYGYVCPEIASFEQLWGNTTGLNLSVTHFDEDCQTCPNGHDSVLLERSFTSSSQDLDRQSAVRSRSSFAMLLG